MLVYDFENDIKGIFQITKKPFEAQLILWFVHKAHCQKHYKNQWSEKESLCLQMWFMVSLKWNHTSVTVMKHFIE